MFPQVCPTTGRSKEKKRKKTTTENSSSNATKIFVNYNKIKEFDFDKFKQTSKK